MSCQDITARWTSFFLILAGSVSASASRPAAAALRESLGPEVERSIGTRLRRQALDMIIFFRKVPSWLHGAIFSKKGVS